MQKTYWWRIGIFLFGGCVFGLGYLVTNTSSLRGWYNSYTDPSMFLSLSLIVVSVISFFIIDNVFKKWLRFSIAWFVLAAILITLAPEYRGGWLGIGPEKESVSIWASVLFVILSIAKLSWDSWKNSIK